MKTLRDMTCAECGSVVIDAYAPPTDVFLCASCGVPTLHTTCFASLRMRYRFNDFPADPDFYKGQHGSSLTQYTLNEDGSESPVEFCAGAGKGTIVDHPSFAGDGAAERRDRVSYSYRKARGKDSPVYFLPRR